MELGGRNTLLYYKDLKVGTLDIGPGSEAKDVLLEELASSVEYPSTTSLTVQRDLSAFISSPPTWRSLPLMPRNR